MDWYRFYWQFSSEISSRYHNHITRVDNRFDIVDTFLIFNLCDDFDLISFVFFEKCSQSLDILCCSCKTYGYMREPMFDCKRDI